MRLKLLATALKLTVFVMVSVLAIVVVANTLSHSLSGPTTEYRAVFTDATGLGDGDAVQIAGVRVGKVTGVQLADGLARVAFEVETTQRIPTDAVAAVRYADLLGARYIALSPGPAGAGQLAAGATIPVERTQPALDLTVLFNGFKPLFDALDPQQVNQFAREIVAVFQGQSGNLTSLLTRVVEVTKNLTGRDKVIGQLLTNLNEVIDLAVRRKQDIRTMVDGLGQLAAGLAADRKQLGDALDGASALATSVSGLVTDLEPHLAKSIASLGTLAGGLVKNEGKLDSTIQGLPALLSRVTGLFGYGSWLNSYVCTLKIDLNPLPAITLGGTGPHSGVCR